MALAPESAPASPLPQKAPGPPNGSSHAHFASEVVQPPQRYMETAHGALEKDAKPQELQFYTRLHAPAARWR